MIVSSPTKMKAFQISDNKIQNLKLNLMPKTVLRAYFRGALVFMGSGMLIVGGKIAFLLV